MSKHTPGPWKLLNDDMGMPVRLFKGDRSIAKVHYQLNAPPTKVDASTAEANAYLIAAAPELLEACHAALRLLRGSGFTENAATVVQLKNAIAKAEGEDK